MKVLYICHLYPEFEASLKSGKWAPTGVPEIAHMIERLEHASNIEPSFIFTHTNAKSDLKLKEDQLFKIKGFKSRIFALAGTPNSVNFMNKVIGASSSKHTNSVILESCLQNKPDIVYCDRENLEAASEIAAKTDIPVIWRVNRMTTAMHDPKTSDKDYRKLLQSPIHSAIATLDGNITEEWLLKMLSGKTKIFMLPSGYDRSQEHKSSKLPDNDSTKILFAGPLNSSGGWEHFVKAFAHIKEQEQTKIEAVVACDGPDLGAMQDLAKKYDVFELFHFLPSITEREMKDVYLKCDVCVSLNAEGNMSDQVLAALSEGLCVLLPESDTSDGLDMDTDKFIPNDAALRFGERTNTDRLAKIIIDMRRIHKRRASFAKNGQKFANRKIQTWQARIDQEIKILEDVVEQRNSKIQA